MSDDRQRETTGGAQSVPTADADKTGIHAPAHRDEGAATDAKEVGGVKGAKKDREQENLIPSGTDATGGFSDTTTDYVDGEIRGG